MCKHAPIGIAFGRVRPFLILRVRVLGMRVLGMVRVTNYELANRFLERRASQARAGRAGRVVPRAALVPRRGKGAGPSSIKWMDEHGCWEIQAVSLPVRCVTPISRADMRDSYVSILYPRHAAQPTARDC